MKEAQDQLDLELAKRDPWWAQQLADKKAREERSSMASSTSKRKRKKRRKRRTPRTSSLPCRARRRHRLCHVPLRPVVDVPVVRFSSNDEICADNFIFFSRFKLNGKGRSEQWVVFLYCDKTIKVDRVYAAVLPWGVPLPDFGGVGFGSSPILDTMHTIYELCPPSERGCVAMSLWWWNFHSRWCLRFCLGRCQAVDWKIHCYFQYQRTWVCLHAECLVQQPRRGLRRQLHLFPVQVAGSQ